MPIRLASRCAVLTLLASLGCVLPACTHTDIAHESFHRRERTIAVEISGDSPEVGVPIAVDVHNHAGSVIVEVDDALDAPEIKAALLRPDHKPRADMPETDPEDAITASFIPASDAGAPTSASTLRIVTSLGDDYPRGSKIALRVRVPRCDGLSVVNNGGPIVILGTDGAVTAQNGVVTGEGGRIEYRTSKPFRDPVALITTSGRISAVIGPGGAGQLELDTEQGQCFFNSSYGLQTDVAPGPRSYRGTWNGGRTPFVARSGDGDITVMVKPDAEQYSTADDWMALFFD